MADWESLSVTPLKDGDVMSLFTTKSASPLYTMNGHVSELSFTPLKNGSNGGGASGDPHTGHASFCQADTVEQCIASINQEITTLGMASLYPPGQSPPGSTSGNGSYDLVRLVNCTHELLTKHRQSSRIREELENREHRTRADIEHLKACQDKLKLSLEQNERDLAQQQERERQLLIKVKALTSKLKDEKDEVKRLQSSIAHREQQYKHEVKKKEREMLKLKERLHQHLTDKTEKRIGLELSDPLIRSDGKRGTWKTGNKQEEEMYRGMISNYEDRQKELVVENTELRQCLKFMQQELSSTLSKTTNTSFRRFSKSEASERDKSEDATENDDDTSDAEVLSEAHFDMPFDVVRDDIQKSVKETVKLVQKRLERDDQRGSALSVSSDSLSKTDSALGATAGTPLENSQILINHTAAPSISSPLRSSGAGIQSKTESGSQFKATETGSQFKPVVSSGNQSSRVSDEAHAQETDKLKKQITRYKDIIEQQEKLLQEQIEKQQEQAENDSANTSILQNSAVWEERESLEAREKLFQEQKANFEQERKSFNEEALRLARERRELDHKRAEVLTKEFMNLTPFREASSSSSTSKSADESRRIANQETSPIHVTVTENSVSVSPGISGTAPISGSGKALASASGESNDIGADAKEIIKKPRSRRLLPPTPSSTPDLNSAKHHSKAAHHIDAPLTTPRVMARPHSSIAISGGGSGASHQSLMATRASSSALRPRSTAPSTAELYKKLGLEPPKDRGRERPIPNSMASSSASVAAKPHSSSDALERHPRSAQPATPAAATLPSTTQQQRGNLHSNGGSSSERLRPSGSTSSSSTRVGGGGVGSGGVSSSADESPASPPFAPAQNPVSAAHQPSLLPQQSVSSTEYDSAGGGSGGGQVTHIQTGFKIDLPSTTTEDNSSSAAEQDRYHKASTNSGEDMLARNNNVERSLERSERTDRGFDRDRFEDKDRNSAATEAMTRQTSFDIDKSRKSRVAPKLGQKYADRRREYNYKYRHETNETSEQKTRGKSPDTALGRSRSGYGSTENIRKYEYNTERSREDLRKRDRSRDNIGQSETRPRSGRRREDYATSKRYYDERPRDSSRFEASSAERLDKDRGSRDDYKLGRSQSRDNDLSDKELRRSYRRESRERTSDAKERHSSRDRADSRDRTYKRESSRDRKQRDSSKERRSRERDLDKYRERSSSERSSDYNTRPSSSKDRTRYSSSRDRYQDSHKYSSRDSKTYHREHKRPHTARDSYFSREHSVDAPISARGYEGRSSLRREASFEGFSTAERQAREDRKLGRDAKDRGQSSQEGGALGSYLRRRSGGSFPVAALILRNPEKMDTFTKSSKKSDH